MTKPTGLLPFFATTLGVMIILFLSLEQVFAENFELDAAKCSSGGAWPPSQCPRNNKFNKKVFSCTDNFIGKCVPNVDDACCDCFCKHSGIAKGGFCKTLRWKQPSPHHFCHCYC